MDSLLNGLSHSVKADKKIVKICTFFFFNAISQKGVYQSDIWYTDVRLSIEDHKSRLFAS